MDEFGLIKIRCRTTSCVHQGQGDNCWFDEDGEGPIIEDQICKSYKEDNDQPSGEKTQ